jgi:hypothetical protein
MLHYHAIGILRPINYAATLCVYACILVTSDPSELAILKGFDFAVDNSGIAMEIIKGGLLRKQVL